MVDRDGHLAGLDDRLERVRVLGDDLELERGLATYAETFNSGWPRALAHKLGLEALDQPGDEALANDLFTLLQQAETDFTLFFRNLAGLSLEALQPAFYAEPPAGMAAWLERYAERARHAPGRLERMQRANPRYVFRNYLAVQAIGLTSFPGLARAKRGEVVFFSFIVYRSKAHRDRVNKKVMADPRLKMDPSAMPFDSKRMAYGGFVALVDA